jgi:hypothetical protein
MLADGSDARAPLTEGNCELELPTAGKDDVGAAPADADGADADGADAGVPLTEGNGELPLGCACAAPDTGGNAPCAHAHPTGAASAVSTMGTRSTREITIISLCRGLVLRPGTRLNNPTISAATRRNAARLRQNC